MAHDAFDDKLALVARRIGFRSLRRYKALAGFAFGGLPLSGCGVLDVGAGSGPLSLWAALHGASQVTSLEPEEAGSTAGASEVLRELIEDLGLRERMDIRYMRLEDLSAPASFDVAILYNVINHLNEPAVERLHHDATAAVAYRSLLAHLRQLVVDGATVIVADCARNNFWNRLGLRAPLARNIEWEKHQQPETWVSILTGAGFKLQDLRWSPLYPFGRLTGNRPVQYFTASHFVLRLCAA